MARRKVRYPEKPWIKDPEVQKRWQKILDEAKEKPVIEIKPKWNLSRWDTLEDVPQD